MGATSTQTVQVPEHVPEEEGTSIEQYSLPQTPKKERRFSITLIGGTPA